MAESLSRTNAMTDQHQHRATDEQWQWVQDVAHPKNHLASCVLELRNHIQALETRIAAIELVDARAQAATTSALYLALVTSKLGHRVEALEAAQHTHIEAKAAEVGRSWAAADQVLALQDQIRDGGLTLAEALKEVSGEPEPAADARQLALVERVADAILAEAGPIPAHGHAWGPEARAAIRVVAAAAAEMHPDRHLSWERVASWLERAANH